jgi:probable addiction module antidote protein
MTKIAPFDAADYLDDEETIAEYLTAALEDPDPDMFLVAVRTVARARGMTQLAKDAGLGRESLYKALSPGAKPRYDTVLKLVHALGVKLAAVPAHEPVHGVVKEPEGAYRTKKTPRKVGSSPT